MVHCPHCEENITRIDKETVQFYDVENTDNNDYGFVYVCGGCQTILKIPDDSP